jgi:TolB-like protein/DNA-binding winged helix-turn-helix (wHTH) protein/Tfp pilus assembly protein PilF
LDSRLRPSSQERYQAGDLVIDVDRQRVMRGDAEVPLPRLSFDLLVALAKVYPRMLTIDELMETVWSPAVVNPETVSQRVKLLRQSLGDEPNHPRYVVGIRGRGYRMAAPVKSVSEPEVEDGILVTAVSTPNTAVEEKASLLSRGAWVQSRWWLLGVAAALSVVLAYAGATRFWVPIRATPEPSVAVLPFIDLSYNHDQQYFADGLSGVIIDQLAMVPGLHVPARTSSFYFKGKQATVPEIAKFLGVAHLLEGTVRKEGATLRITAQLVQVDNGYQVWSEAFDRPLTDVFKIQDEIAGAVVEVLKMSILNHYVPEAARTTNIEAYTLYFRAHSNVMSNGLADYDAAAEQLHSALTLDPKFAAAWGWLALVTIWKFEPTAWGNSMRTSPTPAACVDARTAADRALEFDSTLVQSHRAKGIVLQHCDNNLLAAEGEFRRALELQPRSSDALRSYAWLALASARLDQALQLAQRALSLDPLNQWNYAAVGDVHWTAGRFAEAEAAYRNAVELGPTTAGLHALLANIMLSTHNAAEAIAEAEREPDAEWRQSALLFALDAAGRKSDADRAIAAYELKYAEDDPGGIAAFYACRHDTERTIQWLSRFLAKLQGEYHGLPNRQTCFKNVESDSSYMAWRQQLRVP